MKAVKATVNLLPLHNHQKLTMFSLKSGLAQNRRLHRSTAEKFATQLPKSFSRSKEQQQQQPSFMW